MRLNEKPVHELLRLIERGEIHPRDVIADVYAAIAQHEDKIRAYISLAPQERLVEECERLIEKPLRGLPIAVKDNISTSDLRTTCASRFLENFQPIFDATVIQRLKEAGAQVLGKTNLDEFAMGSSTENSAFFPTRNPHDLERVPGGSSGGSAAAVAAHEALWALGSDTGGSIRQPASFCGLCGLKPTYGLVSRYGLVAFASSLDQIGPMTKDVHDCALLLNYITGRDKHDSTSLERPCEDYTQELGQEITGWRVGVPKEYIADLSGQAKACVESWLKVFQELGAQIIEMTLPHTEYAIPTYYLIASSEASANLARFDGVRYTKRASDSSVEEMFSHSRDQGFGPEVKRRIMIGTYALSAGYYQAWYGKAQRVRALIRQDFEDAFKRVDVIICPTSPTPAFKLGERVNDPLAMYLSDIFTVPASLAGIPAISIPGGTVEGLPFGLQIIADKFQEPKLLRVAYAFEKSAAMLKGMNSKDLLQSLHQEIATENFPQALQKTVSFLRKNVAHYNWVGVYMLEGSELVLKAWDGPEATEHTRIPLGMGICGLAAREKKTVIVGDVNADSRYLACFPYTRSEIVVPIFKDSQVIGEIDIDSDTLNAFTEQDREFLERVATLLGERYGRSD